MSEGFNSNIQSSLGTRVTSLKSERGSGRKADAVTIKGTASGLLMRLRDDNSVDFPELLRELAVRLQAAEKFFRGAHTALDLGRRELEMPDLSSLQELLQKYEVRLEYIISGDNSTRSLARQAGIEFKLPNRHNTRPPVPDLSGIERELENTGGPGLPFDSAEALFIQRTLRSGQLIHHHSDVCLLGDVNPGAEIVAGGNVIVWGSLRGAVQAGAVKTQAGNNAVVCALQLNPMQLSIGELVTHAPENSGKIMPVLGPEMAHVMDGQIIVEPWFPGKKILKGAN